MAEFRITGPGGRILDQSGSAHDLRFVVMDARGHASKRQTTVIIDEYVGSPHGEWTEIAAVHKDGKIETCTDYGRTHLEAAGLKYEDLTADAAPRFHGMPKKRSELEQISLANLVEIAKAQGWDPANCQILITMAGEAMSFTPAAIHHPDEDNLGWIALIV